MNQPEIDSEDGTSTTALSNSVEDSSANEEDESDGEMSSDDSLSNDKVSKGCTNDEKSDGLRWDRTRSRRYNLEMLREYEQKKTKEIVDRMLAMHMSKMAQSKLNQSDEEDEENFSKAKIFSGPDPRGIYARIESQWRIDHCPPSPARQTNPSSYSDRSFVRKTSSVMAAAKFKTNKKLQRQNTDKI